MINSRWNYRNCCPHLRLWKSNAVNKVDVIIEFQRSHWSEKPVERRNYHTISIASSTKNIEVTWSQRRSTSQNLIGLVCHFVLVVCSDLSLYWTVFDVLSFSVVWLPWSIFRDTAGFLWNAYGDWWPVRWLNVMLMRYSYIANQGWARDVSGRDRDETETRRLQVSRRDRDVEVHVYYH